MKEISLKANNEIVKLSPSELMNYSIAQNTKINYMKDMKHFLEWGGSFPSNKEEIKKYLAHYQNKLKSSTLNRRLKGIAYCHIEKKFPDPTIDPEVKMTMKGIRRIYHTRANQALPLTVEHLLEIYELLHSSKDLKDIRNLAIIFIGFFGAFRRSELVNIKYEDISIHEEGLRILIPFSKTDQEGKGKVKLIPRGKDARIDPVLLLKNWLKISEIKSGPIFRVIKKNGVMSDRSLGDYSINIIIKEVLSEIGVENIDVFKGHSLRRGFVTAAIQNHIPLPLIKSQGCWENDKTVYGYYEGANDFSKNPCNILLNCLERG